MGVYLDEHTVGIPFLGEVSHNAYFDENKVWDSFVFTIEDVNGVIYGVDDADAFAVNNSSSGGYVYINESKSLYVTKSNVRKVTIRNVTFKLIDNFFQYTFRSCTNLTDVIFDNITIDRNGRTILQSYFSYAFSDCTSLEVAPSIPVLPEGLVTVNYYHAFTFLGCTALTTPPVIPPLPSGVRNTRYYIVSAFQNCPITTAPEIPALPSGVIDTTYYLTGLFYGCTLLENASPIPALPPSSSAAMYYLRMTFYNCTLLTNALIPNIPPYTGTAISEFSSTYSDDYAGGGCPASPDTPITSLSKFRSGYNYH